MARYDRIAPIPTPPRDAAFPGWLVLQDLVGRERDTELARRARLRFLALRPLLRILSVGNDEVSADSFEKQIESIREELGSLPSRDPERIRISRYLHQIAQRVPQDLAAAAAGLGELAEQGGHVAAAEELYRTAGDLAERFQLPAAAAGALVQLGELCHRLGRDEEAARHLAAAAMKAEAASAPLQWAHAVCAGALLRASTDPGAKEVVAEVLQRGTVLGIPGVVATAGVALADLALLDRDPEAALEAAGRVLEATDAPRAQALARAAIALRALGLFDTAIRCYDALLEDGATPEERWSARAGRAATYAEAGRTHDFAAARNHVLLAIRADTPHPRAAALIHLALARGCLLADSPDFARDHLRDGLEAARKGACADIVADLEALLPQLERPAARAATPAPRPSARARSLADSVIARATPVPI